MPRMSDNTLQPLEKSLRNLNSSKTQSQGIDFASSPTCMPDVSCEKNTELQPSNPENELNWDETKSIMTELETLFKSTEEVKQITELPRLLASMKDKSHAHVQSAKELIKKMTQQHVSLEEQLVPPLSEAEQTGELGKLKENQLQASDQMDTLSQEISFYTNEIQELTQKRDRLKKELEKLDVETGTDLPRLQHSLMLYTNITGIQWDHSRKDTIAGFIGTHEKVREFEFDPMKYSKFEIAEQLWSAIDPQKK